MDTTNTLCRLGVVALSAAGGWWLHAATAPTADAPPPVPAPAAARAPAADPTPLIAVLDDGNVTLSVEREPLDWVLAQIARQGGRTDTMNRPAEAATTPAAQPVGAPCAAPLPTAAAQPLLQAIRHGAEDERFDGLLQARATATPLPEGLLRTVAETDASDRVRLLAFEQLLEPLAGDDAALRGVLQAAAFAPGLAVPQDARRRLAELDERQRIGAATVQKSDP